MNDPINKIDTPRGPGARSMTALSPSSINVTYNGSQNFTGNGSDWFGPLTPMLPLAPPEVAGRSWDYQPGFNLITEPRENEPVTFGMLRSLAEAFDPLRLVIDRRRDQMYRLSWTIRLKHEGPGRRPKTAALSPAKQSIIRDMNEFWKEPAVGMPFRQWLRILLEDHFVIDAPSLFCERSRSGELLRLEPVDGALIKRVIDSWGGTPKPVPFSGQPFVWNGLTITAETYAQQGFKTWNGYLLPPSYQLILKNVAAIDYTTRDLIYAPLNLTSHGAYGHSPVERIINTVNIATRRTTSQLEYFREGNQPEALFMVPEAWTPDQTQRFQDYFDSMLSGNLGARRKLKFMPGGGKSSYVPMREPPLKNDFDEWLTRIVCFALSYPPNAFMNLSNKSTAEQHDKAAEEEGLQSTKLWVADLINGVIEREFDDSVEFAWSEDEEVDQKIQKDILTGYQQSGGLTINQMRAKLGEEPDPSPAANILMVMTPNGLVPIDANLSKKEQTNDT